MAQRDANLARYFFETSALAAETLQVTDFVGQESISNLFRFDINLVSEQEDIDFSDIIYKRATLTLMRDDEPMKINGHIVEFEQRGRTADWVAYRATLVPHTFLLTLTYQSRVFQNMTVQEIITQVLKGSKLSPQDFRFSLKRSYKPREFCVQYRETDFNFISRLMEHEGMYFFFEQDGDRDTLVIVDDRSGHSMIDGESTIAFHSGAGLEAEGQVETISEFSYRERIVTGKVVLKDYNYRTPLTALMSESQLNANMPGLYYEYGQHFKDSSEGTCLAKIRNEELESKRRTMMGSSNCVGLRSGYKFTLEDHYRSDLDGDYLITRVNHIGSQGAGMGIGEGESSYRNDFTCIPADVQYRPSRNTPEPRIPGIMTALVETAGGQYAHIDDQGRYNVKMPFDLSSAANGTASRPIRLAEPYSGAGYGMHFPLLEGAEMVWACIDGNVDRPLGLGTAPNPSEKSPVVATNKSQNVIRTAAGNELILEDKSGDTLISLKTADAHSMVLDDKDDKVEVVTTQKNVLTMDDKNQNITVQTTNGHLLVMDDKNSKVVIQSKNGHRIVIDDTSGAENITMADANDENVFVIDITNKKLMMTTKNGSIDMHAPNGTIDIKATTLKVETKGDSTFKSANTKIEAKQDYSVKGTNIKEEATMDYKEKGMNVKSEASMEHKTKGMNVTTEAGVNMQVKGTMVTVQSSGPNTIKGMPVLIN